MKQKLLISNVFFIGLTLFSSFFGAGNLIFPPALGQAAGSNLLPALMGFLITAVGLPLLGIIAIARTSTGNATELAELIHPKFSKTVMCVVALCIGPFFAIPRTAAVSFDIGIRPLLGNDSGSLFLYTLIFFASTYFFTMNPSKLVARVGKFLTPLLLLSLSLLIVKTFVSPLGNLGSASGTYITHPFFKGFQEGYLTMDLLACFIFSTISLSAIKSLGITDTYTITKLCIYAGCIAAFFLGAIYIALCYLGATSLSLLGASENGGLLLAGATNHYFGNLGNLVLSLMIIFACLTTSIGVTSSCGLFFEAITKGKMLYTKVVLFITLFSLAVSNIGLTKLIAVSIPFLVGLYPVVIVIVLLAISAPIFGHRVAVFRCSMFCTVCFSILAGLQAAGIKFPQLDAFLAEFLPLYTVNFGWIAPTLTGAIIGYIYSFFTVKK
ncbi:MAG: branched-chain amino acid transport system II carrier protein [Acidaminococcaceae bacterium]|nr:branched-chain amino acid transport system II carrier protein [Acidaminococcaceae bacterium]MDD4722214.1 branched-chain amino acid transport system II carrier protein [Acidaminococcaceae bacterium]